MQVVRPTPSNQSTLHYSLHLLRLPIKRTRPQNSQILTQTKPFHPNSRHLIENCSHNTTDNQKMAAFVTEVEQEVNHFPLSKSPNSDPKIKKTHHLHRTIVEYVIILHTAAKYGTKFVSMDSQWWNLQRKNHVRIDTKWPICNFRIIIRSPRGPKWVLRLQFRENRSVFKGNWKIMGENLTYPQPDRRTKR